MVDLIIIGAGLAGLYTAVLAAKEGLKTILVARGRGALSLSHGAIEVWRQKAPSRMFNDLDPSHPYQLLGKETVYAGLNKFKEIVQSANYPLAGTVARNWQLPTASGSAIRATLAPQTMLAGDLSKDTPIWIAQFPGFRDFYGEMIASQLRHMQANIQGVIDLPLFNTPTKRDQYATDLAILFENSQWVAEIIRAWRPKMQGLEAVGIPAVLGWQNAHSIWRLLQDELQTKLFEIPTLPPSVPGLRLERILRKIALENGVEFIEGSPVVGRVEGSAGGDRVAGVVLLTAGGPRLLEAGHVVLATGGVLNGGLIRRQDGLFQETVFDLPLWPELPRTEAVAPRPLSIQEYSRVGIRVDHKLRPLDIQNDPMFENLYAVGGIIGGIDRTAEGSRQGVDLATAYHAIQVITP